MIANNTNIKFMKEALKEAQKAASKNEVPIGAVVVFKGKIIGRGHNQSINTNDPCAHAEIMALRQAAKKLFNYRLTDVDLYVTIEPCAMCAGAMVWARIRNLYYGTRDPKAGASGSVFNIVNNKKLNHRIFVHRGILEKECRKSIQDFFKKKRKK
ncbi:MAG: tRNA adenosine(34) deaminase TadA [bacterium]|nr:tRNA adenosine(34) deaminase TadA [bacterium]MDD5756270.1 tRNA adenosine(34) deaminase TadA [bacterium]